MDAGGLNSRGFGINSTSFVVGDAFFRPDGTPWRSHAALFKGGIPMELGVLTGPGVQPSQWHQCLGQVVGFSGLTRDGTESRAFVWTSQTGMSRHRHAGRCIRTGICDQRRWVHNRHGPNSRHGSNVVTTHAFIYRAAVCAGREPMRDLGVLGGLSSYGMAINNYNHVAGYSTVKTNDERVHAFLHDGKSMIDLGSLGGNGNQVG